MNKSARLVIVAMLATSFGLSAMAANQASTQSKASASSKAGAASKGAATASPFDPALLKPELLDRKAPASYQVRFTTSRGVFVVTVTRAWAPLGADRFYNLVRHHFFDSASFFRVIHDFMAQFGISAHPQVSTAWKDANIKDDPVTQSNKKGFLSFATAGPDTRTTQLFINLVDNTRLDGMGFAPIGEVTQGMDVVEALYQGYGEGAPSGAGPAQDKIESEGKPYLDQGWPKLDSIKTARIVPLAGMSSAKSSGAAKP